MKSIKGSKTEKNILTAFIGESQARNKYTYFASIAKKEGYRQIASIFEETATHEKEHAKRLFKFLEGGDVEINAAFPTGPLGKTIDNLQMAADGEKYEHTTMYPGFARIAEEEGFNLIAVVFRSIANAETYHESRYLKLMNSIKNGSVFKRDGKVKWKCRNCGYIHEGSSPLDKCPACDHPREHFEVLSEML